MATLSTPLDTAGMRASSRADSAQTDTDAIRGIAERLAAQFAETAAERDREGGTPKAERDALRASGLLRLSIPACYGGLGANWRTTLDIVRVLASADSSLAHVFGFHHLMLATVRLFGTPAQWESWFEQTARRDWFWGNALNPLDERTVSRVRDGWLEFSGQKSFCSGALDSEMLIASARDRNSHALLIAAVPTQRSGISIAEDWDNIGQRQTDSGTVLFDQVAFADDELLTDPGPLSSPFACLRPLLAQLILAQIYLGIGEGALRAARDFTRASGRPWIASPAAHATEDPYVLGHYGDFWLALEGARALAARAASAFDLAWARGIELGEQERGEVAIAIAAAKVAAARASLEITQRMFEVTGARATTAALRLDRYWRNLRVHTLHDPIDYKVRELGDWALNDCIPVPSFYS